MSVQFPHSTCRFKVLLNVVHMILKENIWTIFNHTRETLPTSNNQGTHSDIPEDTPPPQPHPPGGHCLRFRRRRRRHQRYAQIFRSNEKGVAVPRGIVFPACVSVNECVTNNSPLEPLWHHLT